MQNDLEKLGILTVKKCKNPAYRILSNRRTLHYHWAKNGPLLLNSNIPLKATFTCISVTTRGLGKTIGNMYVSYTYSCFNPLNVFSFTPYPASPIISCSLCSQIYLCILVIHNVLCIRANVFGC